MTEQPPDAGSLTPEEWDAVRRLRERAAAASSGPADTEAQQPTGTQQPSDPGPDVAGEPTATAEPMPPVAPPPPPEQSAPPVEQPVVPAVAEPALVEPASAEPSPVAPEPVAPEPVEPEPVEPEPVEPEPAARTAAPVALPALAALVVLAVVAAVLAALLSLRVSDNHDKNQAATAAIAAATTGVATVLSYNYRSLDADFAKAEALLTPSFRKQYQTTTAKAVQPLAAKYQAVSTAQVSAAGVITASASSARVLVFVSQQVTNTQLSAPRLDRSRIEVELVHTHGQWLINKLTPL